MSALPPAPIAPEPDTDIARAERWLVASPFAATLQDSRFRLLCLNAAYEQLCGRSAAELVGRDPLELQPPADRESSAGQRAEITRALLAGETLPPLRRRLIDASGQERWFEMALQNVADPGRPLLLLAQVVDVSAEFEAREQVRRAQDELAQWFELTRSGMLMYDEAGLVLRSNAAVEALAGRVPEVLADAPPEWQRLLGWEAEGDRAGPSPGLVPGAPALEREVIVTLPDGRRRRLAARLVCTSGAQRTRRVMAVVEDRSIEDERDLAQLEMGMLMDTASVGVATYDPARGWLAPNLAQSVAARPATGGALLSIGRDLVDPGSLPEYERLQRALRAGERAEVRYEVRHPDLGSRWLLTRVEPLALSRGRSNTSVVTLDVTEQHRAQRRSDQLLRELTGILDTSDAGIALLRWPLLVRCNRRFERLLGFAPGEGAGSTMGEVFSRQGLAPERADEMLEGLRTGRVVEVELPLAPDSQGAARWAALVMRRSEADEHGEALEAVAVLSDVSRLKSQQAELERLLHDRELMFNLSEVGIAYLRGARIERANQAMAVLTGYAPPELTALDPAELYVDARACVDFEARAAEALAREGRFVGERLLRRRDGSLRWVQVSVRPVAGDDGSAAGSICSFVDVDERLRAREALALQAERTRAILDSVLVGIVTIGEQGIQWMNRSARRMFGGELADFVGEPLATLAPPEAGHPLRRADWIERLPGGASESFECRLRGRDGREFWVVGNAVASGQVGQGGAAGAQRQVTFALLDIERRRQAEISIAQAQAGLQRVIETAPLAIALFDARTLGVLQGNQAAASLFGRELGELAGSGSATPAILLPADDAALVSGWLRQARDSGQTLVQEWRPASLPPRVWDCRLAPLAGAGGSEVEQLLLVASDVTEQRAAEQARLEAAIAQRELLVREVHHRIKNNLQGVAGLLMQNARRTPELAAPLHEAVGQVQAIAQVYGLQVGEREMVRVARLVEAIASSVGRTFGREIRVEPAEGAELPHLLPESESIPVALVLNELFTNAIKHGVAGSVAAVRCTLAASGEGGVGVKLAVLNAGSLPEGFDLARVRGAVAGLGLVRALLPRRSATLALGQEGDEVVARVELHPPGVRLPA